MNRIFYIYNLIINNKNMEENNINDYNSLEENLLSYKINQNIDLFWNVKNELLKEWNFWRFLDINDNEIKKILDHILKTTNFKECENLIKKIFWAWDRVVINFEYFSSRIMDWFYDEWWIKCFIKIKMCKYKLLPSYNTIWEIVRDGEILYMYENSRVLRVFVWSDDIDILILRALSQRWIEFFIFKI